MKASPEVLADVRENVGHIGYPGGCSVCKFSAELGHNPHRETPGHDSIVCIGCGEIQVAADHNHVLCWNCEGISNLRRR